MKSHTTTLKFKILILSLSLSFLSLVSGEYTWAKDAVKGETYALTLLADPSKILDSKSGRLVVNTLKDDVEEAAANVGSDNGQKWQFCDEIPLAGNVSVYSVGGAGKGGYLYSKNGIRTNGKTTNDLVTAHRIGKGIRLQLPPKEEGDKPIWLDENLKPTEEQSFAVWMLTKTTAPPDKWEAKCQ